VAGSTASMTSMVSPSLIYLSGILLLVIVKF
jgi:hypothetical protein